MTTPYFHPSGKTFPHGIQKREYYAALAMSGLLPANAFVNSGPNKPSDVASEAVRCADALIEALKLRV